MKRVREFRSNWNLKVLVFKERGKPEYPEKTLSEQGREPTTNSTHIWRRRQDSNLGHIGGRRALSPLRHPLPCKKIVLGASGLQVKSSNRSGTLPPESKGLQCLVNRYYPLIAYSSGNASRKCLRRQQVNPHNDTSHVATNQQPVFCARDS